MRTANEINKKNSELMNIAERLNERKIKETIPMIISRIEEIINEAERMKGAYFYTSPMNASGRRSYEKFHSHSPVEWVEGGHKYSAKYTVECSCRNVYAKGYYYKDDKKTTLTAIKNSLKRLKKEHNISE